MEKTNLVNNYVTQSAKGWVRNKSLAQQMRNQLIPAINEIVHNVRVRYALSIANVRTRLYDKAAECALRKDKIHIIILPAMATVPLQHQAMEIYNMDET